MTFKECANGHIYDEAQYTQCPYCNGGGEQIMFGTSEVGATVAPASYQGNGGGEQMTFGMPEIGATVAPASYQGNVKREDIGKTVGVFQKSMKMEPVVGWFVCIEGPEKGKDYRILAKNNTIGRSEKMDICIKKDDTISRENHAKIAYDEKHNTFHLIPGDNANNIYIDDEPVYVPTKLEARYIVELGETKLMFVPFCNDDFKWNKSKEQC